MKTSFVATVKNEEDEIRPFLDSLLAQTTMPDEVIIVDGGSADGTIKIIKEMMNQFEKKTFFMLLEKKGNRSVGRNEGIRRAFGDVIVSSDAGCILSPDWTAQIVKPFVDESVDVVAGYYQGESKSIFQKCLAPYALVMPDRVNAATFLPASRSMAFKKIAWVKMRGFPERFSYNEDYVFARKLRDMGANIVFAKHAIVSWTPRENIIAAFTMFFQFAMGDTEAGIFRSKVLFLFVRYIAGVVVLYFMCFYWRGMVVLIVLLLFLMYSLWAVVKNYRYVKNPLAIVLLPCIQFVSDIAVMVGSFTGIWRGIWVTHRKQ